MSKSYVKEIVLLPEGFLQVRSGGGEKAKQFTGLQKWATAWDLGITRWHVQPSLPSLSMPPLSPTHQYTTTQCWGGLIWTDTYWPPRQVKSNAAWLRGKERQDMLHTQTAILTLKRNAAFVSLVKFLISAQYAHQKSFTRSLGRTYSTWKNRHFGASSNKPALWKWVCNILIQHTHAQTVFSQWTQFGNGGVWTDLKTCHGADWLMSLSANFSSSL